MGIEQDKVLPQRIHIDLPKFRVEAVVVAVVEGGSAGFHASGDRLHYYFRYYPFQFTSSNPDLWSEINWQEFPGFVLDVLRSNSDRVM